MLKILKLLGMTGGALALSAGVASAQVGAQIPQTANLDAYGPPKGFAPHFLIRPIVFSDGGNTSLQLNGSLTSGLDLLRVNATNAAGGFVDGMLSATFRSTNMKGWTVGAELAMEGSARYTLDATDPFDLNVDPSNFTAYAWVDTPTLDFEVGRYSPGTLETNAQSVLVGPVNPTEADFTSSVGGDLAASISTRQGPWAVEANADIENRQYASVMWRRPVRTITPAFGFEVMRDGDIDFADNPLHGGLAAGTGQLYAGRVGSQLEYGRLTFGGAVGLEAFYDGTDLIEAQPFGDIGVSNKSGRFIYGISAQHRRSLQDPANSTSVAAGVTVAIATGVEVAAGYTFRREDDGVALSADYSHEAQADLKVSF